MTAAEDAREYAAARGAAAVFDLPDRGVLGVSGPLRQKFLQSILSNDVGSGPGQGCLAALMDEKGHLLAFLRVLVEKDEVLLEVSARRLPLVEEKLAFYRVAAPVRFQARPASVLGLVGPRARDVLRHAGAEIPELGREDHVTASLGGTTVRVARAGDLPCAGLVLHVPPEAQENARAALLAAGAAPLGRDALDALRVEEGRAWYGMDVTVENLLHETGLVGEYHSPAKGCYVGQEVVARLEARGGHVNKALRGLRLLAPAHAGDALRVGDQEVGRVTTAAVSPRVGPIALAYVHRSHYEAGTEVEVARSPATVLTLPFKGAGC